MNSISTSRIRSPWTSKLPFSVILLGVMALAIPAFAQRPANAHAHASDVLQQLTDKLVVSAEEGSDHNTVTDTAKNRHGLLMQLLDSSPETAQQFMLPSDVAAKVPASARQWVETDADEVGSLEVQVEDYANGTHRLRFYLNTARERLPLYFAKDEPGHLLSGARVRVRGKRLNGSVLVPSGSPSTTPTLADAGSGTTSGLQTLALASPYTFGAQSTLVLLVNFSDNTSQPTTVDAARSLIFTTLSNFDMENSQNQTWLTGDAFGWFTLAMSGSSCDTNTLAAQAKQAATNAGVNLASYNRYVYLFPNIASCGWAGLGSIGGRPSQAWINGYTTNLQVIGHEMGHNFGLYHAHSLVCSGVTIGSGCSTNEYGDLFDIMGQWTASHFDAFHKEQLGWLNYGSSLPITTVSSSGTYTITPYETGSGSKALKVPKDASTYYYVEYRTLAGFDSVLSGYPAATRGVIVHSASPSDPNSSNLLDINPQTSTFSDAALAVGQTYTDSTAGVTIKLTSANGSAATLDVTLGTSSCTHNNPSVSLTPPQASGSAGTALSYNVTVTNNDSSACSSATFNVGASMPAGWSGTLGSPSLNIAPGTSGSTTVQVTSPSSVTAGLYNFSVSATNAASTSSTGTASASYTVTTAANFSLSASPASVNVTQGSMKTTTITATSSGGFASSVALSASGVPSGVTATFNPATLSSGSGSSTLTFAAGASTATGTYTVTITGTGGGLSRTTSVSLTVAAAPPPANFALSASPGAMSTLQGGTSTTSITSTTSGGFTSAVSLSASGMPAGVTAAFSPASLASGSGTSTLTFTAGTSATTGTFTVIVTGTGGGLSRTTSVSLTVIAAPPPPPPPPPPPSGSTYTLLPSTSVPSVIINARTGVESGLKFTSDQNGYVQGVRFYKYAGDYGTHVGSLWSSSGQLLAQATFSNETTSGWQQVNFGSPVAIQANTTYVVSYHGTFYGFDGGYFNQARSSGPLHAVSNAVSANGVYAISNTSAFPTVGAGGANFWVDVAFLGGSSNASLSSIAINPANATVGAGGTQQYQAIGTYSDSSTRDLTGQVTWSSNTPLVATISNAGLANAVAPGSTQIAATLGSISGTTTLTVNNSPPPAAFYSLFSSTTIPMVADTTAGAPIEVGMKFNADRNGYVSGARFYKGSSNVGPHVASLWSSTGQLLAQATFMNETASGWQQVNFATPVAISANTVYVVSYHSSGYYSYNPSFFSGSMINNPPLHGLWSALSANGVYAYGASSTFPYAGSVGSNFWVDVVFY